MSGLLMMGCGGPVVAAGGGASFASPFVIATGVTAASTTATLTTTADAPVGSAVVLFGASGATVTGISGGTGNTWDPGNTSAYPGGGTMHNYHAPIVSAIASGSALGFTQNVSAAASIIAICFPDGGADDIEGTGTGQIVGTTAPSISISARNSAPQAVAVCVGMQTNASTLTTPSGWTKISGPTAAGNGITVFWKHYTDASADTFTAGCTSTNASLIYRTLVTL